MIGRAQLSEVEEHLEENHNSPLQKIVDEAEIRRIVDAIDSAVDAKDWEICRSFFTDEIEADFTSLAGGEPARMKADDLIGAWRTNLFEAKKSFHQRGNHQISIDGDRAEVFSKGYAFNLLESGEVAGLWEVWGDYIHTLEGTENGWRVSGMTLKVVHQRGNEAVRTFQPGQ